MFLIAGHYRQPLDYNPDALKQATQSVERLRNALDTIRVRVSILEKGSMESTVADKKLSEATNKLREGFEREMNDDFNTPGALAELFTFAKTLNTHVGKAGKASVLREADATLVELLGVLGIDLSMTEEGHEASKSEHVLKGIIELLLQIREDARKTKNYALSDKIRSGLAQLGVTVSDTKDGPAWKIE